MMDWADGIENRNFGIRRITDKKRLSELLWMMFSLIMVAGAFFFYAWVRSQIISIGYASQQLRVQEASLLRAQKNLIVQEATLKSPGHIDDLAHYELGMVRLRPNQLIIPQFQDAESPGPNTLALADAAASTAEPRKAAAAN